MSSHSPAPTLRRTHYAIGGIVAALVLFFAVNIFAQSALRAYKWDLTENKLYTLSDSTRDVLGDVDETIVVRFFFSASLAERVPAITSYRDRIKAILEQYADLSGGKVQLEYYDPEPFSEVEDKAVAFGLQGLPLSDAGDLAYFGLAATNSTDDQEVIPFFSEEREEFLEYDLTRMIHLLANPDKPVVGLLTTVPLLGDGRSQPPLAIMDQVMEFFQVNHIDPKATNIPEEVDILMIVQPRGLSDQSLYALDQFILRGGRAMIFLDPYAEIDLLLAQQQGWIPGGAEFNRMLNAWGLHMPEDKIAADLDSARRVSFQDQGQVVTADYVAWLTLDSSNFDQRDTVMNELSMINLATAGVLEKMDGDGPTLTPLIATGGRTMQLDRKLFETTPDLLKLFREFEPSGKSLVLAARLSGNVNSAFAEEGRPDDVEMEGPHLSASSAPANIIVIADVDLLHDRFWIERRNLLGQTMDIPLASNGDFVVNGLENLAGSPALINLRGRRSSSRPFTMVDDIRQEAEQSYRAKEQVLRTKLADVEAKIKDLVARADASGSVVISDEDQDSIEALTAEMLGIRSELRGVQHELRKDIEQLDGVLKFLNIGAVPIVLILAAIIIGVARRRRATSASA